MVSLHALVLLVTLGSADQAVLVEFVTDGSPVCRQMDPVVERLKSDGFPVRCVDVENQPELARRFGVQPVPTFVLMRDGREVDRVAGPTSYARLREMFTTALPPAAAQAPAPSQPVQIRGQSPDNAPRADVRQQALQATVRVRVQDDQGQSCGTGTIIDTHGDEALIVTCGHLFRQSRGQGPVQVDLFLPSGPSTVPGQLLAYEADERDVALVSVRPGVAVASIPVASPACRYQAGEPVFSLGCDHGAAPSVRETQITAIDRYRGAPNIEIQGQPVDGRSGGGLFTDDGCLIGVCNAADPSEDKGLYAGLASIHWQLKQSGLESLYLSRDRSATVETTPQRMPAQVAANTGSSAEDNLVPVATSPAGAVPPLTDAALSDNGAGVADDRGVELICIVRSPGDPQGHSRVMVLERPSRELIEQLTRASQGADTGAAALADRRAATTGWVQSESRPTGPVVRGQSAR